VLLDAAKALGIAVHLASSVIGVSGRHAVKGINLARNDGSGRSIRSLATPS
jgi:hypothetical protein